MKRRVVIVAAAGISVVALAITATLQASPRHGHHGHKRAPMVLVDTGWHMGINDMGAMYRINLAYVDMDAVHRDDANRFTHRYPSGLG